MWHDFILEGILSHLDPVDLIRAGGVCRNWRRIALRQCFWARFIRNGSYKAFMRSPLKREPKFMFLKHKDWNLLPTATRVFVQESDVLKALLTSGVITVWMLKWDSMAQLQALKKILNAQNHNLDVMISLHSSGRFSLEDILTLLKLSYPRCAIYQALNAIGGSPVQSLLRNDIITFIDLVQTALTCGSDLSRGGLSNLTNPRICDLISCRKATLHEIACLSIPEATRIARDFVWQYVKFGHLSLCQARLLSIPVCSALEQVELFHVISSGHVSLARTLQLPWWALYRPDIVELWERRQISEVAISRMASQFEIGFNFIPSGGNVQPPDELSKIYESNSVKERQESENYQTRKRFCTGPKE